MWWNFISFIQYMIKIVFKFDNKEIEDKKSNENEIPLILIGNKIYYL